jgi:hypothetical protein
VIKLPLLDGNDGKNLCGDARKGRFHTIFLKINYQKSCRAGCVILFISSSQGEINPHAISPYCFRPPLVPGSVSDHFFMLWIVFSALACRLAALYNQH